MSAAERRLRVASDLDVADAARAARELAEACGLSAVEAQHVATAVSEVATNAWKYAGGGEVSLAPVERDGRRGLEVHVRDAGPGIPDMADAMRDGMSTSGSLGLGLPGARRLMEEFRLESRPGRTEVRMARFGGGRTSAEVPVTCVATPGPGGEALGQTFRNGILLAVAAGPRAVEAARGWRSRPWQAPGRLAEHARGGLDAGERLGAALAGFSALDGRLAWLTAGAVSGGLVRGSRVVANPPGGRALSRTSGIPRAEVVDVRRDDVLVLAAATLDDAALVALATASPPPGGPAALVARFDRGALEPRRPATTMEGP